MYNLITKLHGGGGCKNKVFLIALLLLALILSANIFSYAETDSTLLTLTASAQTFSVSIPTTLPITVASDGTVTVSDNAKVVNNSAGPIKVTSVKATAKNGWSLVSYSQNPTGNLDDKKFALKINNVDMSDNENAASTFESIPGMDDSAFLYSAKVAVQTSAISANGIADVVFTIGWDIAYSPLSSIAITTPPAKTKYFAAYEGFNSDGMVVTATYKDGTTQTVTGYDIDRGEYDSSYVTISYTEHGITKETTQAITVLNTSIEVEIKNNGTTVQNIYNAVDGMTWTDYISLVQGEGGPIIPEADVSNPVYLQYFNEYSYPREFYYVKYGNDYVELSDLIIDNATYTITTIAPGSLTTTIHGYDGNSDLENNGGYNISLATIVYESSDTWATWCASLNNDIGIFVAYDLDPEDAAGLTEAVKDQHGVLLFYIDSQGFEHYVRPTDLISAHDNYCVMPSFSNYTYLKRGGSLTSSSEVANLSIYSAPYFIVDDYVFIVRYSNGEEEYGSAEDQFYEWCDRSWQNYFVYNGNLLKLFEIRDGYVWSNRESEFLRYNINDSYVGPSDTPVGIYRASNSYGGGGE